MLYRRYWVHVNSRILLRRCVCKQPISETARERLLSFSVSSASPTPVVHLGSNARKRRGETLKTRPNARKKPLVSRPRLWKTYYEFPDDQSDDRHAVTPDCQPYATSLLLPPSPASLSPFVRVHERFSTSSSSSRLLTTWLAKPTGHRCSKPLYLTHSRVMAPLTPEHLPTSPRKLLRQPWSVSSSSTFVVFFLRRRIGIAGSISYCFFSFSFFGTHLYGMIYGFFFLLRKIRGKFEKFRGESCEMIENNEGFFKKFWKI